MTPEETVDQLVEEVGPNIVVPDPSLIREEAARQARARVLSQRVGAGLCAVLLVVGVFALLNRDQATPVATADDSADGLATAPTTSVQNGGEPKADLSSRFDDWVISNKLDTQITSVRASAIDVDPAISGVRMNLLSFRLDGLDDGREHFAIFSAECGPTLFYGMVEFEDNKAIFRKDQLPVSSDIGFDAIGWECTPPAASRLENILRGDLQLDLAEDGLIFRDEADGITFLLTDFGWNPLYVDPADETTPTTAVPNPSEITTTTSSPTTDAPTTTAITDATTPAPGERGLVALVGPAQAVDRTVNEFTVGVSTCNGSPTAEVVESGDEIVVTATSRLPDPNGSEDCLDGVRIELDQPIGDRAIVDGLGQRPVDLLTNADLYAPKPLEQIPCEEDESDCRVAFSTPINNYSVSCKSVSEESLIKDLHLHAQGVIDGEQVDVIQIKSVGTNIMLAVNIEANCPNSVPNEWSVATKVGNDLDQLSRFLCTLVDLSDQQKTEERCERFDDN